MSVEFRDFAPSLELCKEGGFYACVLFRRRESPNAPWVSAFSRVCIEGLPLPHVFPTWTSAYMAAVCAMDDLRSDQGRVLLEGLTRGN